MSCWTFAQYLFVFSFLQHRPKWYLIVAGFSWSNSGAATGWQSIDRDLGREWLWKKWLYLIGPIPWGHSGPFCHALSLSSSLASWTSMRRRRATVQWRHLVNWREAARCGAWAQHFSNAFCCINQLCWTGFTWHRRCLAICLWTT